MFHSSIKMTGRLLIQKFDENHNLLSETEIDNLVVTAGKNWIATRIASNTGLMTHMALGSSQAAADLAQTTLLSPIGARTALKSPITTSGSTVTFACDFGTNNPASTNVLIAEAGIFSALTGGIMLCRTTFPAITKQSGQLVTITWTISVG